MPVKGVSPFGVSFIPDGGTTWQEKAFKTMFGKPSESTSAAWVAIKKSWETINDHNMQSIIKTEKEDKSAKKAKEDKIVWGKLGNIYNSLTKGHHNVGYSPTQKSLELHWAQQLVKQLEAKVEAFVYTHDLKDRKLKEVAKEVAGINAILQHSEKNLKALDTLKNGIAALLAAKEPEKYAPLKNVPTVSDFFGKELDFKHEAGDHKPENEHAAYPFVGEEEAAMEGEHEQGAEGGAEPVVDENLPEENV